MNDKIYKIDEIKEKVIPIAKDYGIDALFLLARMQREQLMRNLMLIFVLIKEM